MIIKENDNKERDSTLTNDWRIKMAEVTLIRVVLQDGYGEETKFLPIDQFAAVLKPHLDALDAEVMESADDGGEPKKSYLNKPGSELTESK